MTKSSSAAAAASDRPDRRTRQILAAQVRLLYGNVRVGAAVTLIAAVFVSRLQWGVAPHSVILGWCLYMFLVSMARVGLEERYRRGTRSDQETDWWRAAFSIGAGLAGAGWGAAGILLYSDALLVNQVFLIFVLGGMMLGAASILAPRPEAFFAFMLPTGLAPAVRFMLQGGETHIAMGLLAGVFTAATLITTWRIHRTILSSLQLQFENRDLVEDLQRAKSQTEALNEQLEARVEERTAELNQLNTQLRAEIAQREQVEEELLRARKLESLGVLAGGIAHDFNNFLTVVQGNIEMAKSSLAAAEPVRRILDETVSACRKAAFLSSQLLTFAKGGAPVRRLVSVAKLVMDAVHLARAGAQISIEVHIAEDLSFAEVDPGHIGQVLHNILLNAREAMPEGGIIEVRAENILLENRPRADGRIRISIRDYGCGIAPDVLPRIFDPYFTTKSSGSGLGLATSYTIIAKHGGNLSVESKPGYGSVFTIDLPASLEKPAPEAPIPVETETGVGRLLVMDDEPGLRNLLEKILKGLGYDVETAGDGAEAIARFERAKASGRAFDAALLDLTVRGGMGGIETAARLKQLDPFLKLIVSSGYSESAVMSNFRKYGFDDVIPKPWTTSEVSKVFRRILVPDPDRQST